LNKQELLDALLSSNITDDDIRKAREKKKREDEVRSAAAATLLKKRKAFISAFKDYLKALSPTSEDLDLKNFEQELKEIESLAADGLSNISIDIKAGDRKPGSKDDCWKDDYWKQIWGALI
jgi:hypothetical protein